MFHVWEKNNNRVMQMCVEQKVFCLCEYWFMVSYRKTNVLVCTQAVLVVLTKKKKPTQYGTSQ